MDFSGLFKLDVLLQMEIVSYSFYEVGLKKFLAVASDEELVFYFINSQQEKFDKNYYWDFLDNPIYCLCFEPSGTWTVIISEEKVLLVPFLPLFVPQSTFDCKWSLSSVTVLPLGVVPKPKSVVWWLTKESDNILIIGSKNGTISFYSLETRSVVGETKIPGEINDLQICFDDSLDLLTLLITGAKYQQWKLVLEHRSYGYNWLQQTRTQTDKRDGFMSYIKQLSKDKITLFMQNTTKDNTKPQSVEYVLKPTEYLPAFRKRSNSWSLTAQYVNGRHFLSAFELNEGTFIIESPDQDMPARSLRPVIKADGLYAQGLWSQRLIYLLRKNELEVHSFSLSQGSLPAKEQTLLWSAELLGNFHRAYVLSAREIPSAGAGWKEPTFLCDLQLPRFNIEQCLVVTSSGVFLFNTVTEPSEWLVNLIMRGGVGAEQAAAALGAALPALLRAAADLLLSRGKLTPAQYLYSLSQCQSDGWVARLGVFGRLQELSMYKEPAGSAPPLGNTAVTIKLLAMLLKVANNNEEKFDNETKFTNLSTRELLELSSIAACLGLWELLPQFSIHRGHPNLLLPALKGKNVMCRGAFDFLLRQRCVVPSLLMDETQWFYDYVAKNCSTFDTRLLKCLCLWLCPLQDQLRPVIRDMKQGTSTNYTAKMPQLISTFIRVAAAIDARNPAREITLTLPVPKNMNSWHNQYRPRRRAGAGLAHWAVCGAGRARVMAANTHVDTDLIGRVVSVACGRHHTIVLTENGIYTAGDNTYGQLGVGSAWPGAIGDNASANGSLLHIAYDWQCPIAQVSAGHYHSAVVDHGGRLYTWGWGVHGQLGIGSIDDEWSPQIVTKLLGRKVLNVGCGACHTVVLTKNGEVFAFGASVFGQLGNGSREKCSLPARVALCEPVETIAVGYFHTLALTTKGTLLVWGGSPQAVRAAHARRSQGSPPGPGPGGPSVEGPPGPDPHLLPLPVDVRNVQGTVVQIAAGWHHSCLLSSAGILYTWGLNFDGQLGSGDRKQVPIPTEAKINREIPTESEGSCKTVVKTINKDEDKAMLACGGDFSVFVDDGGKIFVSGNTHLEYDKDSGKTTNRVIMMKTTKRVIKIPTNLNKSKFVFQPLGRVDEALPQNAAPPTTNLNTLSSLADFKRKSWPDELIALLGPWIKDSDVASNKNMAAKLAFYNKQYSKCLELLLDDLLTVKPDDELYLAHADNASNDDSKISVATVMSKRIKDISLSILNDQPYPIIDSSVYKSLPCGCDETKFLQKALNSTVDKMEVNLAKQAASVVDKCMEMFPASSELWENCIRLAKDFFVRNDLPNSELESVLRKYMESNAELMASAVLFSNDCVQYSKILSPKFYLNMCSDIMDTWG